MSCEGYITIRRIVDGHHRLELDWILRSKAFIVNEPVAIIPLMAEPIGDIINLVPYHESTKELLITSKVQSVRVTNTFGIAIIDQRLIWADIWEQWETNAPGGQKLIDMKKSVG